MVSKVPTMVLVTRGDYITTFTTSRILQNPSEDWVPKRHGKFEQQKSAEFAYLHVPCWCFLRCKEGYKPDMSWFLED